VVEFVRTSPFKAPIGPNDLLIAAIALANGLIVVTHNTSEFSRVPGLSIEDWEATP
jgi:tRNA(fMet)-specific endonuclease VapC